MRYVLEYVRAITQDWIALMSGIASVVLAAVAASHPQPLSPRAFWIASVACLIFASFRVWRSERVTVEELRKPKFSKETMEEVVRQYDLLPRAAREVVRQILIRGQMSTTQIASFAKSEGFADPDAVYIHIAQATNFVRRDFEGQVTINPTFLGPLKEVVQRAH